MEHLKEIQDKNVNTLKDILRTAEATNNIAIDTNVELHAQGSKL